MSETTHDDATEAGDAMPSGDELQRLAVLLDDVVRGVPGVIGLTAAEPTLLRAAKETVGVLVGAPVQRARVSVRLVGGAVAVETNIAVAADTAAPAVAQAVHRAIALAIPAPLPEDRPAITVRVVDVVPSGSQD